MKLIDAYILARTKRKTRRIRMALVTLVSSLLFALLFFGAFVLAGLQQSAERLADSGYNDNFLTIAYATSATPEEYNKASGQATAEVDAELAARKIKIDKKSTTSVATSEYFTEIQRRSNIYITKSTAARLEQFSQKAKSDYNASAVYNLHSIEAMTGTIGLSQAKDPDPFLRTQKEDLDKTGAPISRSPFEDSNLPFFSSIEAEMLMPLVKEGQSLDWKPGEAYPVLVPYEYLQELNKQSFVNITAAEKIAGYRELIRQYAGSELTFCYRNSSAQEQLISTLQYNKQAASDKDPATKEIATPSCSGLDQAALKKAGLITDASTTNPDGSKPLFPTVKPAAPSTKLLKFRIAGFVPTLNLSAGTDIFTTIVGSVSAWPTPSPFLMPKAVVDANPQQFSGAGIYSDGVGVPATFFDFTNRADQKNFITNAGCQGDECRLGDKPILSPFGSVKVVMEDFMGYVMTGVVWGVAIIGVIAGVMIMLMISKVIADSTKEIAVFRALGARHLDIAQIYMTYGGMLAFNALLLSVIIAIGTAWLVSLALSTDLEQVLIRAVGAYDRPFTASLVGVNMVWLAAITGAMLVASFIGVLLAVLVNARRNVMKLMREE